MQTTKTILMFMVAGGLTLFLSYTVGQTSAPVALSERPIRDYPSSEMKSLMKASLLKQKQEIESMSPEARRRLEAEIGGPAWSTELEQALEAGNASMYESKRLAEQYFTTIGKIVKKWLASAMPPLLEMSFMILPRL